MKRLIFGVLMMGCSASCAEWEVATGTADYLFKVYVDKTTRNIKGSIVTMWTLTDYLFVEKNESGKTYQSRKVMFAYNCRSTEVAVIAYVEHAGSMGFGEVLSSIDVKERELDFKPIPPRTINEKLWRIACNKD